jgi:hypothetical protein
LEASACYFAPVFIDYFPFEAFATEQRQSFSNSATISSSIPNTMKKMTFTFAIGALVASHVGLAETTVSPATDTPTYLKQNKPSESPAATPVPLDLPIETEE